MNIAVFASGGGSNFQVLIDHIKSKELQATIQICIGNNSKSYAFERARQNNIPGCHIAPSHFSNEEQYILALQKVLHDNNIDLIVLAGYMKMIPKAVVAQFRNRIVNIHPALLPAFGGKGLYGEKVHQAVLDYGAKITGITVHFVDEEYDHGPVIFQATTSVQDDDDVHSLAKRVLALEHTHFWRVINAIAQGRIVVQERHCHGTV